MSKLTLALNTHQQKVNNEMEMSEDQKIFNAVKETKLEVRDER